MSLRDAGFGLLGGLLVGALAGLALGVRLTSLPAAEAVVPPTPPVSGPVQACPPWPAPAPDGTADDLTAVLRAQEDQIRGLSDAAFGRPLVWPDPAVREEVEQDLRESISECAPEVRLIEMDCSEPPCMAALDFGSVGPDPAPPPDSRTIKDLCPSIPWYGYSAVSRSCADGTHKFGVLRLGSSAPYRDANQVPGLDFGENHTTRWRVRSQELTPLLTCP